MTSPRRYSPHSVKRWQLESVGLQAREMEMSIKDNNINVDQSMGSQTRFSAWTPIASKSFNKQLFHERVNLVGHWYDLWTDKQRKQFLHSILTRSSRSQLKFVWDYFTEEIPVTKLDFTTVIPRFLSLYILSFLNPHDLCSVAQVSWHWKFLSEQDCLWMRKCTKFGWFLPYTPSDNEYGAWKRHYISCVCSLDYLTPREAAETYGTLNQPKEGKEELEEKLQEKLLRKMLRERLSLHKRELFNTRPPWMSGAWRSAIKSKLTLNKSMSLSDQATVQAALWLIKGQDRGSDKGLTSRLMEEDKHTPSFTLALEKKLVQHSVDSLPKRQNVAGFNTYPAISTRQSCSLYMCSQLHLVLISSHIPACEVVLESVKPGVIPIVYDFNGMTPESLLFYVEKSLDGRTAQSIGLVTDGDSQEIHLLQSVTITSQNVLSPDIREFWEKLGSCVVPEKDGGHIDLFVPLAASESGMEILQCLAQLVGVIFCSPTGITTGSYQHILSEWLTGSRSEPPPFLYFTEVKLQAWCRLASVMEDALHMVRKQMKVYISDLQRNVSGRIIGQFMFDTMPMVKVQTNHEVAEALTEALLELAKETNDRPLEVISVFLLKKCSKNKELLPGSNADETLSAFLKQEDTNEGVIAPDNAAVCQTHSESRFQQLTFLLLTELAERLQEWGPAQCLGDVFMKFGSRLKTYTNFFNNYTVILKTIDKCREAMPIFRAFLKRHDQTVLTKMMSLQELLLSPSTRFEEYVNLLYALRLHTPPEHSDRKDLNAAIGQMKQYKDYIGQLKASLEKETELTNIQKTIQGCPNLIEANRHLAHVQDVLLLSCANEDISASLRIYEHISDLSLFLFNDALVISSRHISYMPFKRTSKTSYQFMASVSLPRLLVEAIPDTKYVKNAFALQGPKRQWICSTITEEERFTWLSASQSAIHASIEKK